MFLLTWAQHIYWEKRQDLFGQLHPQHFRCMTIALCSLKLPGTFTLLAVLDTPGLYPHTNLSILTSLKRKKTPWKDTRHSLTLCWCSPGMRLINKVKCHWLLCSKSNLAPLPNRSHHSLHTPGYSNCWFKITNQSATRDEFHNEVGTVRSHLASPNIHSYFCCALNGIGYR